MFCRCSTRYALLVAVGVILTAAFLLNYHVGQSDDQNLFNVTVVSDVLNSLCQQYFAGAVSGDLCNRLCYHSNYTVLSYIQENKVVLVIRFGGQKLVLKSESPNFSTFQQLPDDISEGEYLEKLREIVNFHLQLDWSTHRTKHLVEILWPSYVRNHELSRADRRSLWSLISQPEYLTFSVLETAKVFPKILGTCGHVYATEYVIPFKLNTYFYGTLRAKILLHLSGTMKLFYDFLNEPLQWCDVKFENLGLHPDYPKRFLVMDGDMIFTESRMNALLASTKCRKDSDCEFFDCSSSCDYTSHRCTTRLNDNVEVFCKKLINQLYGSFWTKSNKVLETCHFLDITNTTERVRGLRIAWAWSLSDL